MAHRRLEHPKHGPVHVFLPEKWDPAEGVTIFVHGFDLDGKAKPWYIDHAQAEFALGEKLVSTMSRYALVAIESKTGSGKPIYWKSLDELLTFLEANGVNTAADVHAIGHSGAFANIALWLPSENLSHVTLLDATYGQFSAYASWALKEGNILDVAVNKGTNTHKNSWSIIGKLPSYHTWQKIPDHEIGHIDLCKIGYMPVTYQHMKWVTTHEPMQFFLTRAQMIRDLENHE